MSSVCNDLFQEFDISLLGKGCSFVDRGVSPSSAFQRERPFSFMGGGVCSLVGPVGGEEQ